MKFSDRFYAILKEKSLDRGWQTAFAEKAKISQDALSKIISGKTKSPGIETVSAIVDALGAEAFMQLPTIRRTSPHAPEETVEGQSLPQVPILMEAGAGPDVEVFSGDIGDTLPILPTYWRPQLWAVRVKGDSMEPLIKSGAYVGVVPLDGEFEEGGLYLVRKPPFGYVVKRVRMGRDGTLVLHSEKPGYEPVPLPYEGDDNVIAGRVVWVWQLYD